MRCYGITKDPETNDFMLVMSYASGGDLYNYLQKKFTSLTWKGKRYEESKLGILWQILDGYMFFIILLLFIIYNL